jgi:hypothetical protein
MLSETNLFLIIKDANKSLFTSIDGVIEKKDKAIKLYIFDLLPIIISILIVTSNGILNESLTNILITGLSIFSGLFFSLIFVVTEKAKEIRKEYTESTDDELINFKIRYLNFSKQLIAQISYSILIALMIILLAFLTKIELSSDLIRLPNYFQNGLALSKLIIPKLLYFILYILLIRFLIVFVIILSSMYSMFLEQINNTKIK